VATTETKGLRMFEKKIVRRIIKNKEKKDYYKA
jgi:hypothetical protein